jgi:16S rRNA (cytosine967-C5)-methyltransferase
VSAATGTSGVSPARACAFAVVRRVFEHGAYADRALNAEASGLTPRDRALAMQLSYGTVQRRATLDHVASELSRKPLTQLDPPVLAALRFGLYQLLLMRGVADHAAVNESVELAKRDTRAGASLVNAVLRRAAREGHAILDGLDDHTPTSAAIRWSVPEWLARQWFEELGADQARALLRRVNEPAESALRVNSLVSDADEVVSLLPVPARTDPAIPEAIVLGHAFDAHGSELWRDGAIMPQSRGSMLVARVLDPSAGDRVLDLCAAPGAKTTHLAALIEDRGEVVAVERHQGRANALASTCARMRAGSVRVEVADATAIAAAPRFDRVLVDPPCSGLGTLQSRPDLRWRARPGAIAELAELQVRVLAAGAAATRPGGTLVYSVCTISRAEGQDVIERFLAEHPGFAADHLDGDQPGWSTSANGRYLQLLPHLDHTDGFFIARLRRTGGP